MNAEAKESKDEQMNEQFDLTSPEVLLSGAIVLIAMFDIKFKPENWFIYICIILLFLLNFV